MRIHLVTVLLSFSLAVLAAPVSDAKVFYLIFVS